MPKKKQISDLPSNSITNRSAPVRPEITEREEIKSIEVKRPRPIRAKLVKQKKTLSMTIAEAFVGDGTNGVGGYILNDVLIPAFKNLVTDAVTSGIEMLVYGETKGRTRRDRERGPKIINYSSFSRSRDRDEYDDRPRRSRRPALDDPFDLESIYFEDHTDAEDVLDEMCDRAKDYGQVSVGDYFEIAGLDGATHAHYRWGWEEEISRARITHKRRGYAILLPDPVALRD